MQKDPCQKPAALNNRGEHILICFHGMVDWPYTPGTHFTAPKSMRICLFTSMGDFTFKIRAWAVRHVIRTGGNSRLNKARTLTKQAIPSKNIPTCWSTDISWLCRTCQFRWKGQCATEMQLLTHRMINAVVAMRLTLLWHNSISHTRSPAKTGTRIFVTGGIDTCHHDYVVTWERLLRLLSFQTSNCF